jgi:hypothetical protein
MSDDLMSDDLMSDDLMNGDLLIMAGLCVRGGAGCGDRLHGLPGLYFVR